MSTKEQVSLSTLPVELIYHIFGYLDALTIVRSVRKVCKQFYTMVLSYDRFKFDFKSILKSDFHLLCNMIQPKNVELLILSDDDETPGQIEYFLSIFRISQFNRLRSLTLLEIDDCHLSIILKYIKSLELKSLSIYSKRDYSEDNTNIDNLLTVITLPRLRTLKLNIPSLNIFNIPWPFQCTIEHLEIYCHSLDEYCNLLCHLSNLRTLVVEQLFLHDVEQMISKLANIEPVYKLSSLILKSGMIDMTILELILPLTPSLKYLQFMQSVDLHDFMSHLSKWEKFVQTKMLLLDKFEFFLVDHQLNVPTEVNTESIIASFRTPFWTETKNWFVICDCISDSRVILLYSPSLFDPQFEYVYKSKNIHRSTTSPSIHNTITMNGVRKMRLDITEVMSLVTSSQGGLPNNTMFPKLDEFHLRLSDTKWPVGSLRFLTNLINLPNLVTFSFEINSSIHTCEYINNIKTLLKIASNIRSLKMLLSSNFVWTKDYNMDICSMVPDHIKHLTVSVFSVNHMQMFFRQLKFRPTIRFEHRNSNGQNPADTFLQWFERENGYYTYRIDDSSLSMWFDKYINITKIY